jgi:hypothetical protein
MSIRVFKIVYICCGLTLPHRRYLNLFPTAQPKGYLIFIQKNAPIHEKINISCKYMNIEIKFPQKYLK